MDYVKSLPDSYNKSISGNNYKLLLLPEILTAEFKNSIMKCQDSLDIYQATGKTLDLYGEIYQVKRGNLNDIQYRTQILNAAMANRSDGTINSVIDCLKTIFGNDVDVQINENVGSIDIYISPFQNVEKIGLSHQEIANVINSVLPVGIRISILETDYGDESFTFKSVDWEEDLYKGMTQGFASGANGMHGGYLGSYIKF